MCSLITNSAIFDTFRCLQAQREHLVLALTWLFAGGVENHRAIIEAEGRPEQGTAFSSYIPLDYFRLLFTPVIGGL